MKIDLIIDHLGHGGSQEQTVTLAEGLHESGEDVRVLAVTRGGVLAQRLESAGIEGRVFGKRFKGDLGVVSRLARALRERQPDVVVTVIFTAGFYGRLAALRAGTPRLVHVAHGVDPEKGLLHVRIDRHLARRTDSIVANCRAVAEAVEQREGVDPARVRVITNGLAPQRFAPAAAADLTPHGVPADRPVLLFVGRLAREKGTRRLSRVLRRLLERDPVVHAVIAGDGPERSRLARRLRRFADRCHLVGAREDVPRLLARASVLLLTSDTEGLPGVLLEAQAAARPVVCTDVGGVREAVIDRGSGFVLPPQDVGGLAGRVSQLLLDAGLAARFGAAGRAHVERAFSRDRYIGEWREHLEQVTSGAPGRA